MNRRILASMLVVFGLVLASGPASARSICADLAARMADDSVRIGDPDTMRKYARAITRQKLAIRQARAERKRQGCGAGSIQRIGSQQDPCSKLDDAIDRMTGNLDTLVAKRETLLVSSNDPTGKAKLQARFDAMGCSAEAEKLEVATDGLGDRTDPAAAVTEVAVAVDPSRETIRIPDDYSRNRFVDLGGVDTRGGLKTVCVRACDGGFFPISNHASATAFQRDAQVCSMMCPGMDTELYYMPLTSDDTASMRSTVTGQRYEDMKQAFAFRTAPRTGQRKACGCNIALYTREMMRREAAIAGRMSLPGEPQSAEKRETAIIWVKPALRPTLGGKDAARLKVVAPVERPWKPDPTIRKVGPDFLLPEQIDFSNPGADRLVVTAANDPRR